MSDIEMSGPARISGVEARARREALGLSGTRMAELLPWRQSNLAAAEAGRRPVAPHVPRLLERLEGVRDAIADRAFEEMAAEASDGGVARVSHVWRDDGEFWSDVPEMFGVPACVHRVALALAVARARAAGVEARLEEAP
jgi:transcriptional regulator with XRE-family HTH domain